MTSLDIEKVIDGSRDEKEEEGEGDGREREREREREATLERKSCCVLPPIPLTQERISSNFELSGRIEYGVDMPSLNVTSKYVSLKQENIARANLM